MASLTPSDWQVSIIDEKLETLDLKQDAGIGGITVMTPTVNRGYEIADAFRREA